jgi:hypothetical protein
LHVDNVPVLEKDRTLLSLRDIVNDQPKGYADDDTNMEPGSSRQLRVIRMPHSNTPLGEFGNPVYFTAAFPVLFSYGSGGWDNSRVSLAAYAKHLMRHRDSGNIDRFPSLSLTSCRGERH